MRTASFRPTRLPLIQLSRTRLVSVISSATSRRSSARLSAPRRLLQARQSATSTASQSHWGPPSGAIAGKPDKRKSPPPSGHLSGNPSHHLIHFDAGCAEGTLAGRWKVNGSQDLLANGNSS